MKRLILRVSVTAIILSGLAVGTSLITQPDFHFSENQLEQKYKLQKDLLALNTRTL